MTARAGVRWMVAALCGMMCSLACATDVEVGPSPKWQKADSTTLEAITRSAPDAQILDVSQSASLKGIAYVMKHAQIPGDVHLAAQERGLYDGYKRSGIREGYEVGGKTDIEWAGMPGFYSELIVKKPAEQRSMLSVFGVAQDGIFSATFVSLEEGRALRYDDELVQDYLKRLVFTNVMPVKPAIGDEKDYQMGYLVGRLTFPFIMIFLGLGIAFVLKRLLKAKTRPAV